MSRMSPRSSRPGSRSRRPGRTSRGNATSASAARGPCRSTNSRAFQVEPYVPNDAGDLRSGGFAKASIVIKREDSALTVPLESIVRFAGVTKIFVVSDDLKARAIPVETGLDEKGWIEVSGALPSQARVVATGQSQLAHGSPVVLRVPHAGV